MGAGAFVMAEITNIPYSQIIVAATIGAVCYFFMILVSVHFEAKRLGLVGVAESEIPPWRAVLRDLHLLIPVLVLLALLAVDFSPHYSAFWSIVSVFFCAWLRRHTRLYPRAIWDMLVAGGKNMVVVALACAGAGMFVACLTVTGFVISISTIITSVSEGNLFVAGLLLMITTLILGMGVPTTAAYIIGAAIGAPILVNLGVPVLGAHLFVFYFAILADATPPVSVASYAAASIAKAEPMRTGLVAFRLAFAGFVIGYSYLYTPSLMMIGPIDEIVGQVLVNLIGLTLLAAALFGYCRAPIHPGWRLPIAAFALVSVLLETYPTWPRVGLQVALLATLIWLPQVFALGHAPVRRTAEANE
jgi:TRAP transporter 4TM/12TM fusion protein